MIAKRALDLVLGTLAAIVLTPVIAACALLVLVTSGWPPYVVQTRVGAGERLFRMLKLRTMRRGAPVVAKAALLRTGGAEERALFTPLGPLLRRWSIDELPQIYSVVGGDMSLVGPRPALPSQSDLLALRRRRGVTALKPGLTGLAQVKGRESLTLATKVRFEAHYLRHRSFGLDVAIIAGTPRALFARRGAY